MLTMRLATASDVDLLFDWANEKTTRENSYNKQPISFETHSKWFHSRIDNEHCRIFIFFDSTNKPVGQVRIEKTNNVTKGEAIISISIGENSRGKGYSVGMLKMATKRFVEENEGCKILAYVFKQNIASYKCFLKAGYQLLEETEINDIPSYILYAG